MSTPSLSTLQQIASKLLSPDQQRSSLLVVQVTDIIDQGTRFRSSNLNVNAFNIGTNRTYRFVIANDVHKEIPEWEIIGTCFVCCNCQAMDDDEGVTYCIVAQPCNVLFMLRSTPLVHIPPNRKMRKVVGVGNNNIPFGIPAQLVDTVFRLEYDPPAFMQQLHHRVQEN
jgi:hypothetical protein